MSQSLRRMFLTAVSLGVVSVALTGCPKAASGPGAGVTLKDGAGQPRAAARPGAAGSGSGSMLGSGGPLASGGSDTAKATPGAGTSLPALPSPREFVETKALRDVHFDFDRYTVRVQDKGTLDSNAAWLREHPGVLVLIEGHTDERGTNEYNLALGERRAKTTRDSLVERGVAPSRITVITYGEERPQCADRAESCWGKNRRAHFLAKS